MFPHFEPEPHTIGTGWRVLLFAAAFGVGVMAAADGDYNPLLRAPRGSTIPVVATSALRVLTILPQNPEPAATAVPRLQQSVRSSASRR